MSNLTDSKRENSSHTQNCDEAQFKIEIAKEPKSYKTFILQQLLKSNSRCAGEEDYKPSIVFLPDTSEKLVGELTGFDLVSLASWLFLIGSLIFQLDAILELTEGISLHVAFHLSASLLFTVGSILFVLHNAKQK